MQNWDKYADLIQELIHKYGLHHLEQIIEFIKPLLPVVMDNHQLIPIAIAIAGTMVPLAVGSTLLAADVLGKLTIFGINAGVQTAKTTCGLVGTTVGIAADVLIKKPVYFLCYPFRKNNRNKEMMQMLQKCRLQQGELDKYQKAYGEVAISQPDKVFLIIRSIDNPSQDIRVMIGSLDKNDRVERLLPIIRKSIGNFDKESIQLLCNKNILRLDTKLSTLPKNSFGAVEVYYAMMETFG